jgi:hypothetical protein
MKADFTRDTFKPLKHFSRVLMQQGRVQLDSDWNEQTAILLHYLRELAADLIGPHGGPADVEDPKNPNGPPLEVNCGFEIITDPTRIKQLAGNPATRSQPTALDGAQPGLLIGKGHYYVDGILCENEDNIAFNAQLGYPLPDEQTFKGTEFYLFYLDAWERHLSYLEDEDKNRANPSIREVALNGPDTATRAQVVWQVRTLQVTDVFDVPVTDIPPILRADYGKFMELLGETVKPGTGQLKAKAKMPEGIEQSPCIISPGASYRGAENQLYRVEIYKELEISDTGQPLAAMFVWSRENGSVIFPIVNIASDNTAGTTTVTLESLGRDARFGLAEGNLVEIVDDDSVFQGRFEQLLKVTSVDLDLGIVTLEGAPALAVGGNLNKHPFLRRWDGTGDVVEDEGTDNNWLLLEDGVQIQFQKIAGVRYRKGDYWLIPARTATGDVEWPGETDAPEALSPHGVKHHYAPLWIVSVDGETLTSEGDCRRKFKELWTL